MRRRIRLLRPLLAVLLATLAGAPGLVGRTAAADPLPLRLQRGVEAFSAGDYAAAAETFAAIERDYRQEPEWEAGALPRRLLPLKGLAEWRAGQIEQAIGSLETFLARFPDEIEGRALARYALAAALAAAGRLEAAAEAFAAFEEEAGPGGQSSLARLERADLIRRAGRPTDAIALLRALSEDPATPVTFQAQARLRAADWALEAGLDQEARDLLLGRRWTIDTMPEMAVLAFAAMELGDRLSTGEDPGAAIAAYRLVPPHGRLVEAQRSRLAEIEAAFRARATAVEAAGGGFWVDYYRGLIARVRGQLEALETSDDYTPHLRLRRAEASLRAGRHHEAWLLLEHLALRPDLPAELREEAHFRWIMAAMGVQAWEEALAIARAFLDAHPESPRAPDSQLLLAEAHLEQRRFPEAVAALDWLLDRHPTADAARRAFFIRGYALAMTDRFSAAREDFAALRRLAPDHPLAPRAAYWHALTRSLEGDHEAARAEFLSLAGELEDHPLGSECVYRAALALYALQHYEPAAGELEAFLERHPHHARTSEARVLLGDILLGQGWPEEARDHYLRIEPEEEGLHAYAVFQAAKAYQTLGDWDGLAAHLNRFLSRARGAARFRLPEALVGIARATERLGRPADALPAFEQVLRDHGDDPAMEGIPAALGALRDLAARLRVAHAADRDTEVPPVVRQPFDDWLEETRRQAREDGRQTWFARLTLALAAERERARQPARATVLRLELARELDAAWLDADALAQTAAVLASIGSDQALPRYHLLLERFPGHPARAEAWLALAEEALETGDSEAALNWLRRIDRETPGHPAATDALLLEARLLLEAGEPAAARTRYSDLLRRREAGGRRHAEALLGVGRTSEALGEPEAAVVAYQRLQTLYQAFDDILGEAYWASGRLFGEIGDHEAARRTLAEFLGRPSLDGHPARGPARDLLKRLSATQTHEEG